MRPSISGIPIIGIYRRLVFMYLVRTCSYDYKYVHVVGLCGFFLVGSIVGVLVLCKVWKKRPADALHQFSVWIR